MSQIDHSTSTSFSWKLGTINSGKSILTVIKISTMFCEHLKRMSEGPSERNVLVVISNVLSCFMRIPINWKIFSCFHVFTPLSFLSLQYLQYLHKCNICTYAKWATDQDFHLVDKIFAWISVDDAVFMKEWNTKPFCLLVFLILHYFSGQLFPLLNISLFSSIECLSLTLSHNLWPGTKNFFIKRILAAMMFCTENTNS